jgi:CDP-6-deoxy-D-xylo-4-hexulose-3-dehydrase
MRAHRCLRAHGWSRELSNRAEVEKRNAEIDPRFLFVNSGFNLRPGEIQAAFGLCQLERLDGMNANRILNRKHLIDAIRKHRLWKNQFEFPVESPGTHAAWFGFPVLLPQGSQIHLQSYLAKLEKLGIENRPIVSGNFTRQPGLKLYGIELNPLDYPGAERIGSDGFFIGLHTEALSPETIDRLADLMLTALLP